MGVGWRVYANGGQSQELSMRGLGGGEERGAKSMGLGQAYIMCCCLKKEAEMEVVQSDIAPINGGGVQSREEDQVPLPSQGLLSNRRCILE